MLAYSYHSLDLKEYKKLGLENFENVVDLYTKILLLGLPSIIRGGLVKEYVRVSEQSGVVKGKIDINSSIKTNAIVGKKLIVQYDVFSEDILFNQIIKATILRLTRQRELEFDCRRKLKGYLPYFSNVTSIELTLSYWANISYNRNNIRYQLLIDICLYLFKEQLPEIQSSIEIMKHQTDLKLASLYEKFVYAFYKRETEYFVARPHIKWDVDDGYYDALPIMKTDLVLQYKNRTLIVDTKFYSDNMTSGFGESKLKQKSGNLYQIYAYINNWVIKMDEKVAGLLLYAQTSAEEQPNHRYLIQGYPIWVHTINLNQDFEFIKQQLLSIVDDYFLIEST